MTSENMQTDQPKDGHTPTPWHAEVGETSDGEETWYINALPGARKGMKFPKATTVVDPECGILTAEDAAFIATACNAHAGMKEALQKAERCVSAGVHDPRVLAEIRAALRTAEGK